MITAMRDTKPTKFELSQSEAMGHYDISRPTIIQWRKQGIVKAKRRGKHWFYRMESINQVEKRRAASVKGAGSAAAKRGKKVARTMGEIEQSLDVVQEEMQALVFEKIPPVDVQCRAAFRAPRLVLSLFQARAQVGDARLRLERARNLISPRAFKELESRASMFERCMDLEEKRLLLFLQQLVAQIHETAAAKFRAELAHEPGMPVPSAPEATSAALTTRFKKKEEK